MSIHTNAKVQFLAWRHLYLEVGLDTEVRYTTIGITSDELVQHIASVCATITTFTESAARTTRKTSLFVTRPARNMTVHVVLSRARNNDSYICVSHKQKSDLLDP